MVAVELRKSTDSVLYVIHHFTAVIWSTHAMSTRSFDGYKLRSSASLERHCPKKQRNKTKEKRKKEIKKKKKKEKKNATMLWNGLDLSLPSVKDYGILGA